ncbi:MAG: hypothetical protein Q9182_001550 [Xanthomendoza sp. 2 TL-2023]
MPPPAKPTLIVSQDFAKPTLPRHSTNGSKRSRASSVHSPSVRLSIIEEDSASHPPIPPRAHHRPFHRRWNLGDPPRSSFESPPPKYSVWDTMGPKGEKLGDVRNNKHIARRGGWRRICLILLILLTLVVGLAVGLSIGLRKKNSPQEQQPTPQPASSSPSSTPSTSPFPAGSYTLSTHLSTILTDCTSDPTLWSCYPSNQTYSASASRSLANLTWTISSSPSSSSTLTISSTSNPFSIGSFVSTPLIKLAAGTDQERYHFSTESPKQTFPNLGESCYFNGTIVEGDLYTRKPKAFPATSPAEEERSNSNKEFQPWPFAVDIRQRAAGGLNTPQCFRMQGSKQGDRVTDGITPRPESAMCSCEYRNFGP